MIWRTKQQYDDPILERSCRTVLVCYTALCDFLLCHSYSDCFICQNVDCFVCQNVSERATSNENAQSRLTGKIKNYIIYNEFMNLSCPFYKLNLSSRPSGSSFSVGIRCPDVCCFMLHRHTSPFRLNFSVNSQKYIFYLSWY